MILTETKAMPIINLLLENAVEKIKEKTNTEADKDSLLYDLSDCDWCFGITTDNEENEIDMTRLLETLDYIIDRNIKWIFDEREEEENVNF